MASIGRTPEDVKCLISHAKLTENELNPVTQTLEFSSNYGEDPNHVTLMEVNDTLLQHLKQGDKVIIKGDVSESAVLCTDDKTFEVREAETSNSLMLCPTLKTFKDLEGNVSEERIIENSEVFGIHYTYLEVRQCLPRLQKLKAMLKECPYGCQEVEETMDIDDINNSTKKKYTWDDLIENIQCSEKELHDALAKLETYNVYGFWQTLDFNYTLKIFSNILNVIEENDWPLDRISRDAILRQVDSDEPRTIYAQCLEYRSTPTDDVNDAGETLYTINEDKLASLLGEAILRQVHKYALDEFLQLWQQSVPEGIIVNLNQLDGIAVVDRLSSPAAIWMFHVNDLPDDVAERFEILFDTKEKWTFDEIKPYIMDMASDSTKVSAILAKYCRASTENGIKHYTARLKK